MPVRKTTTQTPKNNKHNQHQNRIQEPKPTAKNKIMAKKPPKTKQKKVGTQNLETPNRTPQSPTEPEKTINQKKAQKYEPP